MKIKYILMLLFLTIGICNSVLAEVTKTIFDYSGKGGDGSICLWYDITLTFDRPIIGQFTSTRATGANVGIYSENIKSDEIINNTLSNVNRTIIPQSTYVTYSVTEARLDDYYQNNIFIDVAAGYNSNSIKLSVNYDNMNTSVSFNDAVYTNNLSFPINQSLLPSSVLKYLDASPLVESTNSSIKNTAQTVTSNCTDYRTAIIKLCQWIEANIKMVGTNPSNKSSIVYNNKYGDCDGAAHLLAAFCRSLNIPARIVSGYIIKHAVSYPINKGGTNSLTLGSGNGTSLVGHSACEVYVPFLNNWVRCDPAQRTTLFGTQTFIKTATGAESTDHLRRGSNFYYYVNQDIMPKVTKLAADPCVYMGPITTKYKLVKSNIFPGTSNTSGNFGLLCAFDPLTYVGFNDKVIIQDPTLGTAGLGIGQLSNNTYAMSPCSPANFYAKFVSETTPKTYASLFDWSLVLYRSNGDEYVYAQNSMWPNANNPTEFTEGCYWQPSLDVLPAYDWLYDPSGNIYGKIKVTVHIDDGDTKSDETTIGVKPYNTIENIAFDSDMTINACANLNLKNIIISGSPTIIINTNGLGTTINGLFEMPIGATLIINK